MLLRPTQGLQVGCLGPTCQTVKCNSALNAFMIGDDGKMITRVIVYAHAAKKGHVFNTKKALQLHNKGQHNRGCFCLCPCSLIGNLLKTFSLFFLSQSRHIEENNHTGSECRDCETPKGNQQVKAQ